MEPAQSERPISEAVTFHQALCSVCQNAPDFDGQEWRETSEQAIEAALEGGWHRRGVLLLCEDCMAAWCDACGGPCRDES